MDAIFAYQEGLGLGSSEDDTKLQEFIRICETAAGTMAIADAKATADKLCAAGDYEGSVVAYQSAIAMGGNEAELRPLLDACKAKGDAAAAASSALDLALSNADNAIKRGELGTAIGHYQEALDNGGDTVSLKAKIAKLQGEIDDAKSAADDLCAAMEFSKAYKAYDRALAMGADAAVIDPAVASCREREEAAGTLAATRESADQLVKDGDYKSAIATYKAVLSLGGSKAEVQPIIDDLEQRMADLIVTIRGTRDDSDLKAYLENGKLRIQPTSATNNKLIFEGIAANTAFRLVVGARGYTTVDQAVDPIPGKQSSQMNVEVTYLGMMRLEVADWDGSAKVNWEQKSGSTPLSAGTQEITALPGEVVVSNGYGTLRWPFEGKADATYTVDVPRLLPSQLTINGLPEQASLTFTAALPSPSRVHCRFLMTKRPNPMVPFPCTPDLRSQVSRKEATSTRFPTRFWAIRVA